MASSIDRLTREWNATQFLENPEDVVAYLEAAFEDGDSQLIAAALGDIAKSRGMTKIAARTGLGRESLYKSLSLSGNPAFATVLNVMHTLGIRLHPTMGSLTLAPTAHVQNFWGVGFSPPLRKQYVRTVAVDSHS